MSIDDKIINRCKKIQKQIDGEKALGNEEAAQNMAALLQRILIQHKLEMSQIEGDLEEEEMPEGVPMNYAKFDIAFKRRRVAWMETLASLVAEAHGCRIMVIPGQNRIVLVGRRANRIVAEWVICTLFKCAEEIATKAYNKFYHECYKEGFVERARGYKQSFLLGFARRVKERLDQELAPSEANAGDGALVLVKKDLSQVDEMLKGAGKADPVGRGGSWNPDAARHGRKAADDVNLKGNVVEEDATSRGQLS